MSAGIPTPFDPILSFSPIISWTTLSSIHVLALSLFVRILRSTRLVGNRGERRDSVYGEYTGQSFA
jgi:hypothetical protein